MNVKITAFDDGVCVIFQTRSSKQASVPFHYMMVFDGGHLISRGIVYWPPVIQNLIEHTHSDKIRASLVDLKFSWPRYAEQNLFYFGKGKHTGNAMQCRIKALLKASGDRWSHNFRHPGVW